MITQISMFLSVFALFYVYFPEHHKRSGTEDNPRYSKEWKTSIKALKIIGIYTTTIGFVSLLVVLIYGVPSMVATTWTALLAFIALISSLIQFIPQILRTWKLKMVGALSIPAMMMQTPGSFLFCYTIAMSPGTNFTSWVTYFVGGCLQGALLILCLYYQQTVPAEFILIQEEDTSPPISPKSRLLKIESENEDLVGAV